MTSVYFIFMNYALTTELPRPHKPRNLHEHYPIIKLNESSRNISTLANVEKLSMCTFYKVKESIHAIFYPQIGTLTIATVYATHCRVPVKRRLIMPTTSHNVPNDHTLDIVKSVIVGSTSTSSTVRLHKRIFIYCLTVDDISLTKSKC